MRAINQRTEVYHLNVKSAIALLGVLLSQDVQKICVKTAEPLDTLQRDILRSGEGTSSYQKSSRMFLMCKVWIILLCILKLYAALFFLFSAFPVAVDEVVWNVFGRICHVVFRRISVRLCDVPLLMVAADVLNGRIDRIFQWRTSLTGTSPEFIINFCGFLWQVCDDGGCRYLSTMFSLKGCLLLSPNVLKFEAIVFRIAFW